MGLMLTYTKLKKNFFEKFKNFEKNKFSKSRNLCYLKEVFYSQFVI